MPVAKVHDDHHRFRFSQQQEVGTDVDAVERRQVAGGFPGSVGIDQKQVAVSAREAAEQDVPAVEHPVELRDVLETWHQRVVARVQPAESKDGFAIPDFDPGQPLAIR